jgi:hypothetical protein
MLVFVLPAEILPVSEGRTTFANGSGTHSNQLTGFRPLRAQLISTDANQTQGFLLVKRWRLVAQNVRANDGAFSYSRRIWPMCWKHQTLQFVRGAIAVSRPGITRLCRSLGNRNSPMSNLGDLKSSHQFVRVAYYQEHVIWGCREPPISTRGAAPSGEFHCGVVSDIIRAALRVVLRCNALLLFFDRREKLPCCP